MKKQSLIILLVFLLYNCNPDRDEVINTKLQEIIEQTTSTEVTSQTPSPTTSETSTETASPTTSETSTTASETTAETTSSTTSETTAETASSNTPETSNITSENSNTDIETISSEDINYSIYEVQFINENIGFATAGDKLLKTIDGGESWGVIYSNDSWNTSISEVLFLNESVGFINNGDKLLKTLNGGNSFELKYENETNVINPRSISDIYKYNETLIISRVGISDDKIDNYENDDGESYVGIIQDAMIVTSNDNEETFDSYDFYDSNDANCNKGSNICDSHGHFSIAVKDNILFLDIGGYTGNWVLRFDLNENDLEDFVYNDDRQSFVESGLIVETPPVRIKTYSILENYIYAFGHYFKPNFNSDNDNGFIYSTDNGKNWTYRSFGKYENITFFSSYFSSSNVGYIVGELGHFLKTTDGGNNWEKIDLNTYKNIHDIEKINDNTLILVGEDGFIYKYNM